MNNGYTEIILDDRCWVLVNGGNIVHRIFPEAFEALKMLPNPYEATEKLVKRYERMKRNGCKKI